MPQVSVLLRGLKWAIETLLLTVILDCSAFVPFRQEDFPSWCCHWAGRIYPISSQPQAFNSPASPAPRFGLPLDVTHLQINPYDQSMTPGTFVSWNLCFLCTTRDLAST